MASPNIKIYYWGYREGEWNWWEAGYRLNGVDRGKTGGFDGDYYPIAIAGPAGDYTIPGLVSDSVFGATKPFATVPICIVNVGDGDLEEFNIDVASHFWAKGTAELGGGFADSWWAKNKSKFGTGPFYQSSNGYTSSSELSGDENEDNDLWYGEGYRTLDPSGVDPLPDSEDATSSKWASQTSDIYDPEHVGIGFVKSSSGDSTLVSIDRTNILDPANRKLIIGNLLTGGTLNGYYARSNYRSDGDFTQDEGIIDTYLKRENGSWDANDINVWRMGHVWKTCRGGAMRKSTPFNDFTIKNIGGNSLYDITYTNSDIMHAGRILRGYVYVSLYDKTEMNESSNPLPIISGGSGLEGSVFGRFFFSICAFGRYYA